MQNELIHDGKDIRNAGEMRDRIQKTGGTAGSCSHMALCAALSGPARNRQHTRGKAAILAKQATHTAWANRVTL